MSQEELRRLAWRCRRGVLELDLILGRFLREVYPGLEPGEQAAFRRLLALPDQTLLDYVHGEQMPEEAEFRRILKKF